MVWGAVMALEWAIISILGGIFLGLRFKVLVLVPAVIFVILFAVIIGIARAEHFWPIVLGMVILGTAVQIGYLAGTLMRAVISSICAPRNPEINSGITHS